MLGDTQDLLDGPNRAFTLPPYLVAEDVHSHCYGGCAEILIEMGIAGQNSLSLLLGREALS